MRWGPKIREPLRKMTGWEATHEGSDDERAPRTLIRVPDDTGERALIERLVGATAANVASTLVSELITTWHVPVPEQPDPDHPLNVEPESGVAVRVTVVPYGN